MWRKLKLFIYRIYLSFLLIILVGQVFAQKESRELWVKKTSENLVIDGVLDERSWQTASSVQGFRQKYPYDTSMSKLETRVSMLYNEQFLYVSAVFYSGEGSGYVAPSLRRDFEGEDTDAFYIVLDPFSDETSGLLFAVNPYGVQREAIIMNGGGGRNGKNNSWDNKWFSNVKQYPDRWVAEIAIPFKSVRYKEGSDQWRVNFARIDYTNNEYSNWNWLPRNQSSSSLAYTGVLRFEEKLKDPGSNVSLIPYISGGLAKDYEEQSDLSRALGIGGDMKVALSSALNLDLTFNPDFSQVEVDRQVMNLDRFEIYFPEKRQFFLENSDLFTQFGSRSLRPFFSRRIGIAVDTSTGTTLENPIWMGTRLSGKINKDWRIGVMDIQSANDSQHGLPSTNFGVATLHRRVFSRSSLAGIFVNKQAVPGFSNPEDTIGAGHYNRVAGLDFNMASPDNLFTGKVFYHQSFEENSEGGFAHGVSLDYNHPNIDLSWDHEWVDENYNSEVGFIRRTGYRMINPGAGYTFYPGNPKINRISFFLSNTSYWKNGYNLTDQKWIFRSYLRLSSQDMFMLSYGDEYVRLTSDYDPSGTESIELPENSDYRYSYLYGYYRSDPKRRLYTTAECFSGGYYNGKASSFSGETSLRFQPYGSLSMNYNVTFIRLPSPYARVNLYLLGPKIDITFSRNLFFSTLVQYNNQIDNINVNARFQWRYKPVSDLYLVYTDNYFATSLVEKNRAVVFKLTYWLNV